MAEPNSEGMLKEIGICFRYHIFVILSNRMFFDSCGSVETDDLQVDTHESTPKVDPTVKATRPQGRSDNHFFHMIFPISFIYAVLYSFHETLEPLARYKKRERGKLVNAYSASDLQGILVILFILLLTCLCR